jgi:hypothetical protein
LRSDNWGIPSALSNFNNDRPFRSIGKPLHYDLFCFLDNADTALQLNLPEMIKAQL